MPTVRPDIKPLVVFPSPNGISGCAKLRVFPAEAWEKYGGEPGQYRVMLGDAWVSRRGERHSFYEVEGLKEVVWRWAAEALGVSDTPSPGAVLPDVTLGSLVTLAEPDGVPLLTRTRTPAFRDTCGDWVVRVFGRREPVPLDFLTYRERGDVK
jgi:hypothetical protein